MAMTPDDVRTRYGVAAGHFLVVRDAIPIEIVEGKGSEWDGFVAATVTTIEGDEKNILGPVERGKIHQMFEPWATVIMRGPKYSEGDYCPPVVEGQRVYISELGGRTMTLGEGEGAMKLTLIPHAGVLFWDNVMPSGSGEPEVA